MLAANPQAILIGLTEEDMCIRKHPNWRFAFTLRAENRFAVIASARMELAVSDTRSGLLETRIRKMVTKNIGLLYSRPHPARGSWLCAIPGDAKASGGGYLRRGRHSLAGVGDGLVLIAEADIRG